MNTDKGRLFYATGIDNSQLRSDAAESKNILSGIGKTAEQEGNRMDATFKKIAAAAGGVFAVSQVVNFAKKIIEVRGEIESLQISFETLAGKTKGNALFSQIRQFAVSTPMMMKDLAAGAQTMLAFNIEAENVMSILRSIGDISMGDAQKFNSLTLAFSQMSATGKLMGQDLLQMINAGFNPLSVISEQTGKTIGELKEEMEKGKITTEMVTNAFLSATSAGGKFYGMLQKQSHGINGAISNLQGAIDDMYNDIGTASQGVIAGAIDGATKLVKNYETVAEIIGVIVGTYGVYKAAVIANEALIQASISVKTMAVQNAYEAEIEALTALIPEKEAEAQSSLQQAVAAGQITEQKAAEIAAIRAEAEAQMEALAATEAAAKARLMASQEDIAVALKWEDEINNKISALEEEANALFENGDTIAFNAKQEEIAALKAELLEVQKARETAVEAANTAATEMNAAAHQQSAIANAQNTAATEVNTAATGTNTAAQSALTVAKTKLIAIVKKLYDAISAHPYALAAAAVAALAYGIYKLVTYQTDAEKAQERLNDALSESSASIAAETTKIDVMFNRLRRAKEGTEEYEKAKQNIIDQYGNYLKGLDSEISSLQDVEAAYKAITEAVKESMRVKAMDKYIEDEGENYADKYSKIYEKIKNKIADKKGQAFADALAEEINDVMQGRKKFTETFLSAWDEVWSAYGNVGKTNDLQDLVDEAITLGQNYAKYIEKARQTFGISNPDTKEDKTEDNSKKEIKNKAYWEKQKKAAEDELAALTDIHAKGKKGQELRKKISDYETKLKLYSASGKSGGSNTGQQNADLLATEAANRKKQEEQYTKQLSDQAIDSEFEISQARIDAMKDGIDKQLKQNELNYKRLEEQNRRRLRDMLDNLAEQKLRLMEDADPTVFKRKNADGKWEEDPGKRDAVYTEIRAKLTVEDLTDEQQRQIQEFADIATKAYTKANEDSLKTMLEDVLTYEQQRQKIEEEYAAKRNALYTTDKSGNKALRPGVTQGNVDELNRQEQEAIKALQKSFSDKDLADLKLSIDWEKVFGNLDTVATSSLKNLKKKLQEYIKTQKDLDPENLKVLSEAVEKIDEKLKDRNPFVALAQSMKDLTTANEAVKKAQDEYNKSLEAGTEQEKEQAAATLDAAKNAKQKALSDANRAIQATTKNLGEYIDVASSLSDMLEAFGVEIPEELTGFLTGISNAIGGLESIDLTRPFSIISGTFRTVTGLFQGIGSLFGFGNGDKKREKRIENLQSQIEDLADAIETLGEKVDDVYSKDASALIEKQNEMLRQQKILIQNQIKEEESKKKTDKNRIDEWQKQIEEIDKTIAENSKKAEDAIFGQDIQNAIENFADAYASAWEQNIDAATSAKDTVKSMMQNMVKESIKAALQSSASMEKIRNKLKEFFADNVLSGWEQDYIYNMAEELQKQLDEQFGWAKSLFEGDSERTASQKGIASASQESIDELNGRATAIQSHTFSINENTKTILATTQAILRSVMNIETETSGFGSRLERIEGNIKEMNNTIGDMATRGIKLKN